jgi:hypothetical protein
MRSARGDVRDPNRFTQKRPRTFVSALASIAAAEMSKHRLSRYFQSRSRRPDDVYAKVLV